MSTLLDNVFLRSLVPKTITLKVQYKSFSSLCLLEMPLVQPIILISSGLIDKCQQHATAMEMHFLLPDDVRQQDVRQQDI